MRTLLYHTGALGDFITILPALSLWRDAHPGDSLTLFGRPEIASFAIGIGCVDAAIDVTLVRNAHLFNTEMSPTTAEILGKYSHAILFSFGQLPLIGHCRKMGLTVFEQPPFPSDRMHVADYHVSLFADPLSLPDCKRTPKVRVPDGSLHASFSLVPESDGFCLLHAGSGSVKKNWPFDRFIRIADELRNRGKNVIWLRGPAETNLGRIPDEDRTIDNPALPGLAAILARADLFLGNDSGVAHLSAAVGCPSFVIFGPSDPLVWAPRGDRVTIIYKEEKCSPCHLIRAGTQSCDQACLGSLTVDDVRGSIVQSPAF
jgi:ADP-heptose:LPS heptosyltransferase